MEARMIYDQVHSQVDTARRAMQREWGTPNAAVYALDAITIPLLAIADELGSIRQPLEKRNDA
jgi:hypothetical protein